MANILVGVVLLAVLCIAAHSVWRNVKSGGCSGCGGSCPFASSAGESAGACPHCAKHS